MVEVGEMEEGLNILDIPGFGPILDDLDFVWGHGKVFGPQHISEVFTGSDVELTFVCLGNKAISMESVKYFFNAGFVFRDVVGVDEYVFQVDDGNYVDHV